MASHELSPLATDLATLNLCQMTRTTTEVALHCPNFHSKCQPDDIESRQIERVRIPSVSEGPRYNDNTFSGCGSRLNLVTMVTNSWPVSSPGATEDLQCTGANPSYICNDHHLPSSCFGELMHVKSLEAQSPLVGVVNGDDVLAQVSSTSLDRGTILREEAVTTRTCQRGLVKFCLGDFSLRDEPRSGQPSDVSDEVLHNMIRTNPTLASTEVSFKLGIHLRLWTTLKGLILCLNSPFVYHTN
ncbi:histone-lysine N-methyltransferase SETMAR [Trichonephila clavipes]|nr:histone-lysine N-methyltransferase SETMAR [Trichonephila clavipes]